MFNADVARERSYNNRPAVQLIRELARGINVATKSGLYEYTYVVQLRSFRSKECEAEVKDKLQELGYKFEITATNTVTRYVISWKHETQTDTNS